MRVTRRQALAAGALALVAPREALAVPVARRPEVRGGAFRHGVAAGVPTQDAITLWTRVSDIERSGRVVLEVARDAGFRQVLQRRPVAAVSWRDFTARATVRGLPAGEELFYRFATRDVDGPVGRFRTLRPPDSREPVRIGFFCCQKYVSGFYTAHAGLAAEPDLDLVVSLGDYIYETAGRGVRRDPTGTVETLAEYRAKHAQYRTDPDLQAMHARHAFAATWDDHEFENDYAGATPPPGDTRARRIAYAERMRQAHLAFFEWMPRFRLPADPSRVFGSVPLGALAELLLVDTRQYRDDPPCGGRSAEPCLEEDDPARPRAFLGAAQKAWLKDALAGSRATWKVLANQTMLMGLQAPPGVTQNPDQWDGYPRERAEVLGFVRERGIRDVTVLTGDVHAFFAGDVHESGNAVGSPAVATEFVTGSVSSTGFEEELGPATTAFAAGIRANNPHIKDLDLERRGYGVLEARADELRVTFRSPTTVAEPRASIETIGRYRVPRGTPAVEVL